MQNTAKLIQNSGYGITGDRTSRFYQIEISSTIPQRGRIMILTIKYKAERDFRRGSAAYPDCPFDADVIFGDTDSIGVHMVGLGMYWVASDRIPANDPYRKDEFVKLTDLEGKPILYLGEAFKWAILMAKEITKLFNEPCKLEFEKLLTNFVNMLAKNYISLKWEVDATKPAGSKLIKGTGFKKRFLCQYIRDIGQRAIDTICYKSDPMAAIKEARADMAALFRGDVSPVHMSLTQKLSKDPKKYKTRVPAVALALRRMRLDPTDVVRIFRMNRLQADLTHGFFRKKNRYQPESL